MVMELLRGKELGEELEARGPLPVREAVGFVLQACAGMAEAHRAGIVHRDLKPSNLFLCDQDGRRIVKVLDFGISKLQGDVQASMTTTATAFGTPLYMSPEQVRSAKHVDARADVWALGVVLYELLSGQSPFARSSATAILAAIVVDKPPRLDERGRDIPAGLAKAVMKALEKDPDARYTDVLEFAAAIAPYGPPRDDPGLAAIHAELSARRSGGGASPAMTAFSGLVAPRRKRTLVVALAVVTVAIFSILAVLALKSKGATTAAGPAPDVTPAVSSSSAADPTTAITPTATTPTTTAAEPSSVPTAEPTATASAWVISKPASKPATSASGSAKSKSPAPTAKPSVTPVGPTSDPKYL
jgi:serine/threonine-protein kinase